jgi:hypothetical protein
MDDIKVCTSPFTLFIEIQFLDPVPDIATEALKPSNKAAELCNSIGNGAAEAMKIGEEFSMSGQEWQKCLWNRGVGVPPAQWGSSICPPNMRKFFILPSSTSFFSLLFSSYIPPRAEAANKKYPLFVLHCRSRRVLEAADATVE